MTKLRKKIAIKKILENNGKSISKAMRDAGYSKNYSKNPQQFTKTKGWQELMKTYLPDDLLAQKHSELLNARRIAQQYFNHKVEDEEITKVFESQGFEVVHIKRFMTTAIIYYFAPNTDAQGKALDLGYKLKGKYAAEKIDLRGKYSDLSNKELAEKIEKLKRFLLKK